MKHESLPAISINCNGNTQTERISHNGELSNFYSSLMQLERQNGNEKDTQRNRKGREIYSNMRWRPTGSHTSRLPHFQDNRLTDGGEVVGLTRRLAALYPKEDYTYSFLLEAESTPGPY
jgi:hypothetical protein